MRMAVVRFRDPHLNDSNVINAYFKICDVLRWEHWLLSTAILMIFEGRFQVFQRFYPRMSVIFDIMIVVPQKLKYVYVIFEPSDLF